MVISKRALAGASAMAVSASLVAGGALAPVVALASDDAPSSEVTAISKTILKGAEVEAAAAESATEGDAVGSLVSKTVEMGTDKAVEAVDGAADAADQASNGLKDLSKKVAEGGQDVAEKVKDTLDGTSEKSSDKATAVSGAVTVGQVKASKEGKLVTKESKDLFAALREANALIPYAPGPTLDAFHQLLFHDI